MAGTAFPPCAHCGAPEARTSLSGTALCDRCVNDRISQQTGWPRLPDPPPIETVRAADGREVRFRTRLWWAPSGLLVAEAEEVDQPPGDGFEFSVTGALDADPHDVLARLRRLVHREVAHRYLEPDPFDSAVSDTTWAIADREVFGRIDASGDPSVREPSVVIDGRRLDWDEFGRMVAPFEGWQFRMRFVDRSENMDP